MGITLELIITIVTMVLGMWSNASSKKHDFLLATQKVSLQDTNSARKLTDTFILHTRRIIVVCFCFYLLVAPLIATYFGISITVMYMTVEPSSLFGWIFGLGEGTEVVKFHAIDGFVIPPMYTQMLAAIVGFYFGSGGSRR